jgi:hypothetical protein
MVIPEGPIFLIMYIRSRVLREKLIVSELSQHGSIQPVLNLRLAVVFVNLFGNATSTVSKQEELATEILPYELYLSYSEGLFNTPRKC